ncbi:MAG: branched-chain amino acid aminotransferase [Hyphomicrobiales bacterium]|nr:branched-chain amino acid aminotransferase [Rickettsiales bacterium]MCP5361405.1 branched-chain amino acid aminotransferase [Hyphomicrobiales bacterium]
MSNPVPFDDRDGYIWFDGKIVPWREATIHVLNHGLHYGSCVFEGERVYHGKVFKLNEHTERLHRSANLLGFALPFSVEALNRATEEIVQKQNIVDGYVRPVAWRGSEQMAILTTHSRIHVAIACWTWPAYYTDEAKRKGAKLTIEKHWKRPAPDTAPTASKAAGLYMIGTITKNQAHAGGFQEALMTDWRGYIAETTSSNFFLVIGGELHTPIPDCFLDGITRRTVMELARKRGIKVVERHITLDELSTAQEAFMTGTAAEVTPVGSIDALTFTVGPVTTALMDDYAKLVAE